MAEPEKWQDPGSCCADAALPPVVLNTIFNAAQVGIVVVDADSHTILHANPKALELIGAPGDEVCGATCHKFICPAECGACPVTDLGQTVNSSERILLTKSGARVPILKTVIASQIADRKVLVESFLEIGGRKEAEEALRFSNTILSTVQETALDGILVVDENEKILSFNRRFLEISGVPQDLVAKRDDRPALAYFTSKLADPGKFSEKVQYLYSHRNETSFDELLLKDGRILDRFSAPIIGENGRYYGRVWYLRDISRRKLAEKQLQDSKDLYQTLAESSPDMVYLIDPKGIIRYINSRAAQQFGKSPEKLPANGYRRSIPRKSPGITWLVSPA